jgi:hypothetical protein
MLEICSIAAKKLKNPVCSRPDPARMGYVESDENRAIVVASSGPGGLAGGSIGTFKSD